MGGPRETSHTGIEPWPAQQVHVEWGRAGLEQATARGDGVVIVDVLSFSTLVTLVTERGAAVRALAPDALAELGGRTRVAELFDAHVAGETRDDPTARVTLSPASAVRVQRGDRLVVPSLNGGTLTSLTTPAPFAIVAGLRNGAAAGRFVAAALRLGLADRVTIIAAGERWKRDCVGADQIRFAIEDWLGAGLVARACRMCDATLSAEADGAARSFEATRGELPAVLAACVSGRELMGTGFETDVALAAAADVDPGISWLGRDGFIARLPFALRPATPPDRPFLFALKAATMREYVAEAFGQWDEADERRHFDPDLARIAVVSVDGRNAAMVETRVEHDRLYLANLQVSHGLQSRGIGRAIVGFVASAAHARGHPLVLRVLKVNPRARQFYERLGLQVTGELPRHWSMTLPLPDGSTRPAPTGPC
jgi:2-phosphosulfolactate phosphatase